MEDIYYIFMTEVEIIVYYTGLYWIIVYYIKMLLEYYY